MQSTIQEFFKKYSGGFVVLLIICISMGGLMVVNKTGVLRAEKPAIVKTQDPSR